MSLVRWVVGGCAALAAPCVLLAEPAAGTSAPVVVAGLAFDRALNGATAAPGSGRDRLVIESGEKTDFFRETDGVTSYGNAPVLLTGIDNTRPFTFTTRVTPDLAQTYDAGALYLWSDEATWLKFAFERDENGRSRIVTVRTRGTSDDNNHDVLAARSAFLRVSSDTRSLGFYYSGDGRTWQLVRVFRNDYPARLWLGLSAQSPLGRGNRAVFSSLRLTGQSVADFRKGE
ncbi:DUF1349 domain-containing protein [Novosphingobium piscinae]|uniref:DUF1349 domain-containing protein n=1 Tax=Novosphingobium piscinae TaxID=1507448 RepID=A0A7X1KND6_9SPHN|nr:DUF1349 domain-containing protein [Novosphingobium piscinae]MBC2667586.1 DUF1349 domain-containing protein [Novosphingobium piscinae]